MSTRRPQLALEFTPEAETAFEALKKKAGTQSGATVIRKAMAFLDKLEHAMQGGWEKIRVTNGDSVVEERSLDELLRDRR